MSGHQAWAGRFPVASESAPSATSVAAFALRSGRGSGRPASAGNFGAEGRNQRACKGAEVGKGARNSITLRRAHRLDPQDHVSGSSPSAAAAARHGRPSRHGPPDWRWWGSNRSPSDGPGACSRSSSAAVVTSAIIRPEFRPGFGVRKAGRSKDSASGPPSAQRAAGRWRRSRRGPGRSCQQQSPPARHGKFPPETIWPF